MFDAEGLTKMTQAIEERRKTRNDIEQNTQVAIAAKNLEAQTEQYQIHRDTEYARLDNEREIAVRVDQQNAEIESQRAQRATEVRGGPHAVAPADPRSRDPGRSGDRDLRAGQRHRGRPQVRGAVARPQAKADQARALAVKAAEEVETARSTEIAERSKRIELIAAPQDAEKASISIVVAAEAEKQAAKNRAEAARTLAEGEAEAAKLRAAATEVTYAVEAQGKQALNEAANQLSPEQIAMNVRMALIEALPQIIAELVKPMENIDGHQDPPCRWAQRRRRHGNGSANGYGGGGLADQAVDAALRYRSQAPLIDALLQELGLNGGSLDGLVSAHGAGVSRPRRPQRLPAKPLAPGEVAGLALSPPRRRSGPCSPTSSSAPAAPSAPCCAISSRRSSPRRSRCATMIINITGSLAMGLLIGILARTLPPMQEEIRLFVAVGILGGFTTFCAFSLDAVTLWRARRLRRRRPLRRRSRSSSRSSRSSRVSLLTRIGA